MFSNKSGSIKGTHPNERRNGQRPISSQAAAWHILRKTDNWKKFREPFQGLNYWFHQIH